MQIRSRLNRNENTMLTERLKNPPTLPLVQGPLAGYTHSAFRRQVWKWGNPLWAVSEMLPANLMVQCPEKSAYRLSKHPEEGPLVYQLSGNCPITLGEATHYLTENHPASGIDLNVGCPKKKIRKKGCGSALLAKPDLLYRIVSQMRPYTPFLTVKIRTDRTVDAHTKDIIGAIESAGADALIMHARHWTETDEIPCHWDQAATWIANCNLPVIINGNLGDRENIEALLKHTGAKGAMIARGSSGQPWLIGSIQGRNDLHSKDKYQSLMQHLDDLAMLVGPEKAYLQSRSLLRYYQRYLPLIKEAGWQEALSFDDCVLRLKRTLFGTITQ